MIFQLVIPAYNEADSLPALTSRAVRAAIDNGWSPAQFRLIVVNNGSTDNSAEVLRGLLQGDLSPWLQVVTVRQNRGYGDGIQKGLEASAAPYVGWTHADEQCDPADAFRALRTLLDSPLPSKTVIKGRRSNRSLFDFVWSRFFELAVLIFLRTCIWEINAQPKVFSRDLLAELTDPPPDFAFDLYALYRARRAGWRISAIPVQLAPRAHGESKWASSFKSRIRTSMKMFLYIRALAAQSPQAWRDK